MVGKDNIKGRVLGLWRGSQGRAAHPDLLDTLSVSLHPADLTLLNPCTHPIQPSSCTQPIYIPTAALQETGPERSGEELWQRKYARRFVQTAT